MLRLDLTDGTVLGFTDHDKVIDFDLGDGAGVVNYRPDFGMQISNVQTAIGLDAGNYEVTFPIALWPRPITRAAVAGGRFSRCEARLFQIVWSNPAAGPRKFMFGNTGEWRVEGDKAIAEVRDQRDRLNQTVGRQLQSQCDAGYADQVRCFATPTEIAGTVSAVASAMQFTVAYSGTHYADGFFDRGKVSFSSGGNTGTRPVPIWSWDDHGDGTATIALFMPLVEQPAIGDALTVRDGCDQTARGSNGCVTHGQILNFRGCDDVPGMRALKPAIPNSSAGSSGKGGK